MQQRQPETGNEIVDAEDLIDGRGTIPIDIIMDGGADGVPARCRCRRG